MYPAVIIPAGNATIATPNTEEIIVKALQISFLGKWQTLQIFYRADRRRLDLLLGKQALVIRRTVRQIRYLFSQ